MHQLTIQQLANDVRHEQLAAAERQRPARHLLALRRTTRRARRDERLMRRAARQAQPLREPRTLRWSLGQWKTPL
jgi:hypothetical protein